jgi:sugar lactone lactonase YvrE
MKNHLFLYLMFAMVVLAAQGCKKARFADKTAAEINSPLGPLALSGVYVSTFAGTDDPGFVDGSGDIARLYGPRGITALGAYLYCVDQAGGAIRRIKISDSTVTTLAGGTETGFRNGSRNTALFNIAIDIAAGPDNNLYVTDYYNHQIRKVTCDGLVSTYAGCDSGYVDGPVSTAKFGYLVAIGIGKDGTKYVYDFAAARIRKITTAGIVSTYAGSTRGDLDGPAATAKFGDIQSIAVADDGTLYVADAGNNKVKKISTTGMVTTVAGSNTLGYKDGPGPEALFRFPNGVVVTGDGSLYLSDVSNDRIRIISPSGVVSTLAGASNPTPNTLDGPGDVARFFSPLDLVMVNNTLFVTDSHKIRKVTLP